MFIYIEHLNLSVAGVLKLKIIITAQKVNDPVCILGNILKLLFLWPLTILLCLFNQINTRFKDKKLNFTILYDENKFSLYFQALCE